MSEPAHATVKLVAFKLDAVISRLNFAVSAILAATSEAIGTSFAGFVSTTIGAIAKLGVPRIGSCPPEPPQATSKHESVAK